jgi:hypothetical protein
MVNSISDQSNDVCKQMTMFSGVDKVQASV